MKKYIALGAFLLICSSLKATVVQKIYLKNGTVLNGYIQQQDGEGQMIVQSDEAVICLKNQNLSIQENRIGITNSSKTWQEWAKSHPQLVEKDGQGNKVLQLSNILLNASNTEQKEKGFEETLRENRQQFYAVRILEKGPTIKFLELTSRTYRIKWSDVAKITSEQRAATALSGLSRCYTLKSNQQVKGEYAGETEETVSLYNPNGYVETIRFEDVTKINISPINPNQDIFQQSALLDDVQMNSGLHFIGVITEYDYTGKNNSDNFITLQDTTDIIQHLRVSDIASISKLENKSKYDPQFDIILQKGEVVVNRKQTVAVKVNEDGDLLTLDSLAHNITLTQSTPNRPVEIAVEYHAANSSAAQTYQLVQTTSKINKKKTTFSFSYKDLVNKIINPTHTSTSVNQTTKITYSLTAKGVYALYDAQNKKAIPIIIK